MAFTEPEGQECYIPLNRDQAARYRAYNLAIWRAAERRFRPPWWRRLLRRIGVPRG